tara:strand:+ start:1766 stop:5074 length:3309 start_codon:yes stop_codon:yes gene_type:complete
MVLVVWLMLLAAVLGSNRGLEAALPDRIKALKEDLAAADPDDWRNDVSTGLGPAAIDIYAEHQAQQYRCMNDVSAGKRDRSSSQKQKIYAVVPIDLPWATKSLYRSCDSIQVVMPTWYTAGLVGERVKVSGVAQDTRDPLLNYTNTRDADIEILPIIALELSHIVQLSTIQGRIEVAEALSDFVVNTSQVKNLIGYCVDASQLVFVGPTTFADILRPFANALNNRELTSCVTVPSNTTASILIIANWLFDTVIVDGYRTPWIGSAPQPLADDGWFEAHVAFVRNYIDSDKLVVKLGNHAVDWVSGQPRPSVLTIAQVMSALADRSIPPEFDPAVGNSQASYVDAEGLQHRVWMLDAATAHNQILALNKLNVASLSLAGLGYEDPGIWAVLDHLTHGVELSPDAVTTVIFSDYVELLGSGPFVAPVSMPQPGERAVVTDPVTSAISSVVYSKAPKASTVRLYGAGQPNKVVLTFDDGPHSQHTADTLDILRDTKTPAAFFVLGNNAVKSPDLIKRILEEGHELGSHTYSHPKMGNLSASRATVEVNSVQLFINGLTGKSMRLYREPYMRSGGPITSKEVASLLPLEEAGYIIVGMDVVPRDWIAQSADELAVEIIRQVEENAGGIVLLHDGGGDQSQTVAALPKVITELRSKGYEFTSVADLLGTTAEVLMPESDRITATFGTVSFFAVGNGWSILKFIFWAVFAVGMFRSITLLLLTAKRKPHLPPTSDHQPSVTIVIPAYNEGKVIEKCIRQALSTRYDDFDIIVVDDGSTDDTYDKAISFAYHPLVTVLSQSNAGKASALNAALDEAQSDILICIDADSQISPDAVGLLAAHFNDPKIGAVAGRVVVGNRSNLLTRLQALEYITAQSIERRAKEFLNAMTVVPGAIGAWRTTALMEAGIFSNESLTEDADMTMAIIRTNYQVVYEDRAIATTETPATLRGLMAQRLRWSLGMMQSGWKHVGAVPEGRKLGIVALPDLAIFGYMMPLIAPLADLFLLLLALDFVVNFGTDQPIASDLFENPQIIAYLALPALEILSVVVAFRLDPKEDRRLMWLMPLQRVFYRQVLYISVIRALWRAATGSLATWGRTTRVGFKYDQAKLA